MPRMRYLKWWLQAVVGGMVMCGIMLILVALACAVVAFTAALAIVGF